MSKLFNAVQNVGATANGAVTLKSSLDANVDLFFLIGSSRGKDISGKFLEAFNEDADLALRILLWGRDVRGGAGERQTFRSLVPTLPMAYQVKVMDKIGEIGRWDDLLAFLGTKMQDAALSRIQNALAEGNGLCAKWMPRKGEKAATLRKYLCMSPREYRKTLVRLSSTVEQLMCAKEWDKIEYGHVPSVAAARYQKAFSTRDEARYAEYRAGLEKGTEKINASAIFPHDIVKAVAQDWRGQTIGDEAVANAQWKALPNYLEGSSENVLPMVDVSGSMNQGVNGNYQSPTTCLQVAVSLGLYLAERTEGLFKNEFLTFSSSPELVKVQGDGLRQRVHNMSTASWGMSTDLEKAFALILDTAKRNKLEAKYMPSTILVLSDMEFNSCTRGRTNLEQFTQLYKKAGYELPKVVFWNLNAREGNVPAPAGQKNVALVSGFSPAILKGVLGAEDFSPRGVMLKTVMVERYDT